MTENRLRLAIGVIAALAVLAVDFALGVSGWPSWLLTLAEGAAAVPWAWVVLGRFRTNELAVTQRASPHIWSRAWVATARLRAALVGGVFVLLLFGSLALKLVLLASGGWNAAGLTHLYRTYLAMAVFVGALGWVGRGQRALWFFGQVAERPARMLPMSVLCVSLLGGFLLATPFALTDPTKGSFVDALFDATGALCGALSVSDVGRHYQLFGQIVILALMQIGGFGIMVLSASVVILARRRLEVKSSARFAEVVDAENLADLRATVLRIIVWTVVIEALGAVALYFLFDVPGIGAHAEDPHPLAGGGGALWSAVFHSVSAFCNAGFSLFRGNLAPFVDEPGVTLVICLLIVLGGLGFPVLSELARRAVDFVARRPRKRLSLHARVVLTMTAGLVLVGALSLGLVEWTRSFGELPASGKVLAALFQSVTARTAGFSNVDLAAMSAPGLLLMIALMFIGAGPGSTGGGIKVTTLAVLFATFRAEQTAAPAPTLFGREIPAAVQRKAIVVTFLSALLVVSAVFFLLLFEETPPLHALFEVTSAFGSVGCSTGAEAKMGAVGKLVLVATMMIGRVGPLTFALAAAGNPRPTTYRLPEERVMIG